MAMRTVSPTRNPDVEESRAELDLLEGQKKSAQIETLAVAADKQKVEQERKSMIAMLDVEIEQKQKDILDVSNKHSALIKKTEAERVVVQEARDKAVAEKEAAEKDRDAVKRDISSLSILKTQHTDSIEGLSKRKSNIAFVITALESQKQQLQNNLDMLQKQINSESVKLATLMSNFSKSAEAFEAEKKIHADLTDSKAEKIRENITLNEESAKKRAEIADLVTSIAGLQKNKADQESEISDRDAQSNKRMANATALETKVDAKLAQLKEFESHFTTEHLARVGYKPIGT